MSRHMGLVGCSILVMALLVGTTQATEYKVGDSFGWNVPTNQNFYSEWASSKNFLVGDKLVLNWTGTYTVAIVSKDDYDNCNTSAAGPFGRPGVVPLSEAGHHYFISTVGNHCASGQKLSINVESGAPAAQPPESSTSAPTLSHLGLLSAFVSTLGGLFLHSCLSDPY